ncbi:hypothetical protein ACFP2T_42435 [Plantactinospora solaniradicis]|uniref:WD40 repeat domain-containing protein n=1 Tax=Plantactinospora solaniradicis TaxID=1723736 RepID=A0ABW1KMG3_9ACTN
MPTRTRIVTGLGASVAAGAVALAAGLVPAQASGPTPVNRVPEAGVSAAAAEPPVYTATLARSYDAFDANQGIAVDDKYFYVVDNRSITKHDKATGRALLQFVSNPDGPIIHLDSGVVVNGKLYAGHSNYDESPMESSIEVFDTRTMRHLDTYSFGIFRGSLTWLDRHDGAWWAGFANYDEIADGETEPYGGTYNTQVVKLDDQFRVVEAWTIPKRILDRFTPMSNSGGSWGPDGRLWLTGHDLGEAYVMRLPSGGAELEWVGTVTLPAVEGQGIAWEHSGDRSKLWAIKRSSKQALSFTVPHRSITDPKTPTWQILGPGNFQQ